MNVIFKIMLFTMMLNFSTGIMAHYFPDLGSNPNYNININASNKESESFIATMNSSVSPSTETNSVFRILSDNIFVGTISRFLSSVNSFMFGFNDFICNLFGLDDYIKYTFNTILGICYALGTIWLWTGKKITD